METTLSFLPQPRALNLCLRKDLELIYLFSGFSEDLHIFVLFANPSMGQSILQSKSLESILLK